MTSPVSVAMAIQTDLINKHKYPESALLMELAATHYEDPVPGDILEDIDPEDALGEYREVAGRDWLRVLELLVFWRGETLAEQHYFED